jgi:protein-L-isoaspartate(D-aspartate) O-methyltransferase
VTVLEDMDSEFERRRDFLIAEIAASGEIGERALQAMRSVRRHEFVPDEYKQYAYENRPLPIGERQTISQPLMVGLMTEALDVRKEHIALEIGTGSGYQAAILAELCRQVYTLERHQVLAEHARETLQKLGYTNVEVVVADGSEGYPPHAPYDRILVTAGSPGVPETLVNQLALGGKLVIPVGDYSYQSLTLVEMTASGPMQRELGGCVFVPLIGKYGWNTEQTERG